MTVWQNLLIPNIPAAKAGRSPCRNSCRRSWTSRPVRYCAEQWHAQAIVAAALQPPTQSLMRVALANHLDSLFKIEQPVNLHVTGCPHSCAQHYIGDIGLLGAKVGGAEGYQVVIGGGSDQDRGLARELIAAIPFSELPPVMERLFGAYTSIAMPMNRFSTSAADTASKNFNHSRDAEGARIAMVELFPSFLTTLPSRPNNVHGSTDCSPESSPPNRRASWRSPNHRIESPCSTRRNPAPPKGWRASWPRN